MSAPTPQSTGGQIGLAAGTATRELLKAGPKVWLVLGAFLVLIVVIVSMNTSQTETSRPSSDQGKKTEAVVADSRPKIPPPQFRVFRSKLDQGTTVVVAPATTDEQLKSLLWLFREKVRSHHFKDIGITQPTSKQFGKTGYLSGMISVYRGEKCANEYFADYAGTPAPCGDGEHDSAFYQWGLLVDGVFNTDADSAAVKAAEGNTVLVFDYKDHWQLPATLQADVDGEKKVEQDKQKVQQASRKLFAEQLQRNLSASGFDITVWARDDNSEELALDSDIFKDTATRVEFLNDVLPKWRHDLCSEGFRQVRLMRGGIFSTGDAYSIGCR